MSNCTSETGHDDRHPKRGFIVFCENNLRYEGGIKAWIFLGPYLLGAIVWETIIQKGAPTKGALASWLGFLVYLVLFPPIWRRILRLVGTVKRTSPVTEIAKALPNSSKAVEDNLLA